VVSSQWSGFSVFKFVSVLAFDLLISAFCFLNFNFQNGSEVGFRSSVVGSEKVRPVASSPSKNISVH